MTDSPDVTLELASGEVVIIHPGDVAVLTFDCKLSSVQAYDIREVWAKRAPTTHVIILANGAKVGAIIRAEDVKAAVQ